MTDEEYREFLEAIYRKYVRAWRGIHHPEGLSHLHYQIERLASKARFARVVAEHAERVELYAPLAAEIEYPDLRRDLEESGILTALDAHAEEIFGGLRRSVIPDVDIDYLRLAGVHEAEAEIVLLIRFAQDRLARSKRSQQSPSQIVHRAEDEVKRVAKDLKPTDDDNDPEVSRKPPKLFNGIAKILAGGVLGAGNLLVGVGAIAASGPATAHTVIGSCALAVAAMGQGIGDLRGE